MIEKVHLAVAEKSVSRAPNVYIYDFETLNLHRVLRKGTERGYACVQFSPHDDNQIAALGCYPDYLLTIWDWKQEQMLLKCKAFSQDVFRVSWGQYPGQLLTSGVGHIRFWKMAETFTGLKLQGAIGKFGQTDLSDVVGFAELPDGKVITGSEYGKLLLWEGGLIKCELCRKEEDEEGNEVPPQQNSIVIEMIAISNIKFKNSFIKTLQSPHKITRNWTLF